MAVARRVRRKDEKVLKPVHPNAGIAAEYRRRIEALVDAMAKSVTYWVRARYKANEPRMALDEVPANELQRAIDDMTRQWDYKFDDAADRLAKWFAKKVYERSGDTLAKILEDAGLSVEFKMTAAMRDVFNATVEQNVALIKSIPSQYLTQVQGSVMRSVQAGRDLGSLTKDLQEHFGVTRRRAATIARSQNNMATATMTASRQKELGITHAIWLHSGGGREPRPSHVAQSGKPYDVNTGWFDPDEKKWILPGTLINCRCVSRPVIKGFS